MLSDGFSLCWEPCGFATSRMWIPTACPNPTLRRLDLLELIEHGTEAAHDRTRMMYIKVYISIYIIYIYIYICTYSIKTNAFVYVYVHVDVYGHLRAYHALLGQILWEDPGKVLQVYATQICVASIFTLMKPSFPGPQEDPETRGCHWRGRRIVEHANAAQTDSHLRCSEEKATGRRSRPKIPDPPKRSSLTLR